jgi:nitronate monooxygenase
VTAEGDASPAFKEILAGAREEDMVEFVSVAGLPARAVKTPWLAHYLEKVEKLQARAKEKAQCIKSFDCLAHCGLRDGNGKVGQFCIDHQLTLAYKGEGAKGLFFRGVGDLPFGKQIRSVKDLMSALLMANATICPQN